MAETKLITKNNVFYVFSAKKASDADQIRIVDKKGFIKVQRGDGDAAGCTVAEAAEVIERMWEDLAVFKSDIRLQPDLYICIGGKVLDYSGMRDLEQVLMVVDTELNLMEPEEEIIIVGARNDI